MDYCLYIENEHMGSEMNNVHESMNLEFEKDAGEVAECEMIDAVLAILPDSNTDEIADLMTGFCTAKEIVAEIRAIREAK